MKTFKFATIAGALMGAALLTLPIKAAAAQCNDTITGGGWIFTDDTDTTTANFGVSGGMLGGALWVPGSSLNYVDESADVHVVSTAITGYTVDGSCRIIDYDVLINGVAGTATVTVCDNGEPGTSDTFAIELSTGYSASGTLGGGEVGGGDNNLHVQNCP